MTIKVENGNTVSVHYKGTLDDGTEFDSSYKRGEPVVFEVGTGKMISGFDAAVCGMEQGEIKTVTVLPENGYGDVLEEGFHNVPVSSFAPDETLEVGTVVHGQNEQGSVVSAVVSEVLSDEIILNFNHPLAGKNMNFEIELIEISHSETEQL
jgi:peptidylprolyl isomerase